ncbi:hypothetical protein SAMD00023353_12700100 [Rosellinia necatrix]|uniref:Uncharacterized protein n=1 Tax=Rosellinia necatrix TaxID=77044 RepID=A0A1S8ABV8_ROSNE|nr:hypothetical protein SAMD00023353_12700100 [Rosellinia necatrix]
MPSAGIASPANRPHFVTPAPSQLPASSSPAARLIRPLLEAAWTSPPITCTEPHSRQPIGFPLATSVYHSIHSIAIAIAIAIVIVIDIAIAITSHLISSHPTPSHPITSRPVSSHTEHSNSLHVTIQHIPSIPDHIPPN